VANLLVFSGEKVAIIAELAGGDAGARFQ